MKARVKAWWQAFKCRNEHHDFHDAQGIQGKHPVHFYAYTCRHCSRTFKI